MENIIIITGPTASGKTALGIELAKQFNGEIINADSVIFYKHLNIGAAKPDQQEQQGIPHHLIDILELDQHFTAHDFINAADQKIKEITNRGKRPIISGGSPLYIKALLKGLFEMPEATPQQKKIITQKIELIPIEKRHQYLCKIDPESGERLHPNDHQRVNRAIEVFELTNTPLSHFQKQHQFKQNRYNYLKLAIHYPRPKLYHRINQRVDMMIHGGLMNEAEEILKMGFHPKTHKSLRAIGYPEMISYLEEENTLEDAVEQLKQNTRRFAKRQLTWLRKESEIKWLDPAKALDEGITHLSSFLENIT